jgi:predicted permease
MPAKKYFLSPVDLSREIRRPSLVGMQFFYKGAVSASDLFSGCAGLNSKNLIGLLVSHFSVAATVTCVFLSVIISRVFMPLRFSPIQISGEQRAAIFIYFAEKPD